MVTYNVLKFSVRELAYDIPISDDLTIFHLNRT